MLAGYFFFFNDTATTEIYTLSLHDALPIYPFELGHDPVQRDERHVELRREPGRQLRRPPPAGAPDDHRRGGALDRLDRKSTRLKSSHANISYAAFCLKKKKKHRKQHHISLR